MTFIDPEQTLAEGPFAKQIAEVRAAYRELRQAVDASERRVMLAIVDVGSRCATVELVQQAWEGRILELERKTEPCPPPEAA